MKLVWCILAIAIVTRADNSASSYSGIACKDLYVAQYCCAEAVINPDTQQPVNCGPDGKAFVPCFAIDGVYCDGEYHHSSLWIGNGTIGCRGLFYSRKDAIFNKSVDCYYVGDKSYLAAVSLSVFLGMFGLDRFYLGYPALGLLKLCTGGMFLTWWLLDIILIASQVVGPADGTSYLMDYYGPRMQNTFADVSAQPPTTSTYEAYDNCYN